MCCKIMFLSVLWLLLLVVKRLASVKIRDKKTSLDLAVLDIVGPLHLTEDWILTII